MIIRKTRDSDNEQIYELFRRNSITKADLSRKPRKGFYEYLLEFGDMTARADSPFSIVWDSNGRILSYILAYPISRIPELASTDPVHMYLLSLPGNVVYVDQLYTCPHLPITYCARLADTWDHILRSEGVPGAVCAIPESPYRNVSATRFALDRGYSRRCIVREGETFLRLFLKPFLEPDMQFDKLGDVAMTFSKNN